MLDRLVGLREAFHILSAYRSPAVHAMLRLCYAGMAEHSRHVEGKAVDVRFFGHSSILGHRLAPAWIIPALVFVMVWWMVLHTGMSMGEAS